ncbi:MAG: TolC family protein [Muribaculaceae bacterium]|nr:TolC family protein [Muribaculaceae bacterium]
MKAIYAALAVMTATPAALCAQESSDTALPVGSHGAWSLDSCINYAIIHNLTVQNRELNRHSGELDITEAKHSFLPTVSGSASESVNFGRGLTSENTYANRNTTNFSLGLNAQMPLFQMRNISQLKYAKTNLTTLLYEVEAAKDDVTLNVITAYLQVLYTSELLATPRTQVEWSSYEYSRQKALADAGKIAEIDVVEAQSQLEQDKLQVVTSTNDYTNAVLDLAQLLKLGSIENFSVLPLADTELPIIPKAETIYREAMMNNNSVLASRNSIKAAESYISVAKSGYMPTLSLMGGLNSSYYTVSGFQNNSFRTQMRENFSKMIGVSLQVPLFDGFSTRNAVRKAKVQRLQAQLQLDQTETELYRTIQSAYYKATGARQTYLTALETEAANRAAFEAMQEKYNIGRANPQEFEQSKNTLLRTTLQRIQSHYECLLRYRVLMFYKGDLRK